MKDNEKLLKEQTENNLNNSFRIIDTGLKMFDNTLNRQMNQAFILFLDEYERSGREPSKMNLGAIQKQIKEDIVQKLATHMSLQTNASQNNVTLSQGSIDLYIINASGIIEYSTYIPDIGLDFKLSEPSYYDYLTKIRLSEGFFPDRVVQEQATGNLRKYAYMPTPDHKYVLELGLTEAVFSKERSALKYTTTAKNIEQLNPYVEDIRIFTAAKRLVGNRSFIPDKNLSTLLDRLFSERKSLELIQTETKSVKYLFIDLMDPNYAADMSLVLEITYNNAFVQDSLRNLLLFHFLVAILAITVASAFAVFISRTLTKPITEIVSDVDIIAKGDLDHKISKTKGIEFSVMEQSINTMVDNLKRTIQQLQNSETLLKKSEEELRESEKKYKDLVSLLPQSVFEIDNSSKIIFANQYAYESFGYSDEDLKRGLYVNDVLIPEELEKARKNIELILNGGAIRGTEYVMRKKDGSTFPALIYSAPTHRDNVVTGLRGVIIDISELKKIEGEIRKLNEELERHVIDRTAELRAANIELESFTYSVSHDLRAPLRAIDGFSGLLLNQFKDKLPLEAQQHLEKIRASVQQMASLIDALLEFSRTGRQSLEKQMVQPSKIVHEILDEMRPEQEGRRIELSIQNLPPCEADPSMIRQVFQNLLSNALKFSVDRDIAKIDVGSFTRDSSTIYFVRDNGVGFDMQYAANIFKVFQRLHDPKKYKGTGVGLAIVQRIIQRHGGTIWVESDVEKGTTFFFTIGGGISNE